MKQEQRNTRMEQLFKAVIADNPGASEKELKQHFIDAIRQEPDLVDDAINWFLDRHYLKN